MRCHAITRRFRRRHYAAMMPFIYADLRLIDAADDAMPPLIDDRRCRRRHAARMPYYAITPLIDYAADAYTLIYLLPLPLHDFRHYLFISFSPRDDDAFFMPPLPPISCYLRQLITPMPDAER